VAKDANTFQVTLAKDVLKGVMTPMVCVYRRSASENMPDFRFHTLGSPGDDESALPKSEKSAISEAENECEGGKAPSFLDGKDWCSVDGHLPPNLLDVKMSLAEVIVNATLVKAHHLIKHLDTQFPEPVRSAKEMLAQGWTAAEVRDQIIRLFPGFGESTQGTVSCAWCTFGLYCASIALAAMLMAAATAAGAAAFIGIIGESAWAAAYLEAVGGAVGLYDYVVSAVGTKVVAAGLSAISTTISYYLCPPCHDSSLLLAGNVSAVV